MTRRRLAIPRSVTIRGRRWRVRLMPRRKPRDMRGFRGLTDPATRTIWIDRRVARRDRELTFCHELVHAMLDAVGGLHNDQEERVAYGIEGPLRGLVLAGVLTTTPDEEVR